MNNPDDNSDLLDDILAESSPGDFRDATLAESIRQVRRRRHLRQARRVVGATLGCAILTFLAIHRPARISQPSLAITRPAPACLSVSTSPLSVGEITSTRPFRDIVISSSASIPQVTTIPAAIAVVTTSSVPIVQISTTPAHYRTLGDSQLLSLLTDRSPILIRTGPTSERLILADNSTP